MFSVIIPAYNAAAHLPRAFRAVLAQTKPPAEVIVTDDGSSDGTAEVVREFARLESRLPIHLIQQANGGIGAARNAAIRAASSPWLAFLDADDSWAPRKLERVADWIGRNPDSDVIYHDGECVWPDGRRRRMHRRPLRGRVFEALMTGSNPLSPSATVVRRDWALKLDGFWERRTATGPDDDLHGTEDLDFWMRLAREGARFCYMPEVLEEYHRVEGSLTMRINYHGERSLVAYQRQLAWVRENRRHSRFWCEHYRRLRLSQNMLTRSVSFAARGDYPRALDAERRAIATAWWWWKPYANLVRLAAIDPAGAARVIGVRTVAGLAFRPLRFRRRLRLRTQSAPAAPCCLAYHDVPPAERATFARQIGFLQRHYEFIDYPTFVARLRTPIATPRRELLLTFDDGFRSSYEATREVLEPRGIQAMFFLPTGFLDAASDHDRLAYIRDRLFRGRRDVSEDLDRFSPMTWDQVTELACAGHAIGAHTVTHADLSEVRAADLAREITQCAAVIQHKAGCEVRSFAVPFGTAANVSAAALRAARARYETVFTSVRGDNQGAPWHGLRRETVTPTDPPAYVGMMIEGGLHWRYRRARARLDGIAADAAFAAQGVPMTA